MSKHDEKPWEQLGISELEFLRNNFSYAKQYLGSICGHFEILEKTMHPDGTFNKTAFHELKKKMEQVVPWSRKALALWHTPEHSDPCPACNATLSGTAAQGKG